MITDTIYSIFGLGYIGLPTAAILASKKINIVGVDTDYKLVKKINNYKVNIPEPGLKKLVNKSLKSGYLKVTNKASKANVFIIAVPTPIIRKTKKPNLSYIKNVFNTICPLLEKGNLIIIESTIPVGTTEFFYEFLSRKRPDLNLNKEKKNIDINIAYCPERVLPGSILSEIIYNDRVIGGISNNCSKKAAEVYNKFIKSSCKLTNSRTAEMCKLTENSFRDTNIAFANELSILCDEFNVNVWELIKLANFHPRVNILTPGPGVGGHCIAVDPLFIVNSSPKKARLISMARKVNDSKPDFIVKNLKDKIKLQNFTRMPNITCLGLTFKANVDDLRESPSMIVVKKILDKKLGNVKIVEPHIDKLPKELEKFKNFKLCSLSDGTKDFDYLVVLVDHKNFKNLKINISDMAKVIDTKGLFI